MSYKTIGKIRLISFIIFEIRGCKVAILIFSKLENGERMRKIGV